MILTEEKAKAINERIKEMKLNINGCEWHIQDGWKPNICLGIMGIVSVTDLTETISHLETIRNIIEEETGIKF